MKKTISTSLAIIIALTATGLASSASAKRQWLKLPGFSTLDSNSDGGVSKIEMGAKIDTAFPGADANGDGFLDTAEFHALLQARGVSGKTAEQTRKLFQSSDTDGNGRLDAGETLPPEGVRMFSVMDRNDDGNISLSEWNKAQAFMHTH